MANIKQLIQFVFLLSFLPNQEGCVDNTIAMKKSCKNEVRIPPNKGLQAFKELEIDDSNITTLQNNAFQSWGTLKFLILRECKIKTITNDAFQSLSQLLTLSLIGNYIVLGLGMSMDVFEPISQLQHLDLSRNPLASIPDNFFKFIPKLKVLIIDNTVGGLDLNNKSFYGLKNLVSLDLANNQLYTLPYGMKDSFPWNKNLQLNLELNKIHCDCKLRWLTKKKLTRRNIRGNCKSPQKMEDKRIYSQQTEQYTCDADDMWSEMNGSLGLEEIRCDLFTDKDMDFSEIKSQLEKEMSDSEGRNKNGWKCVRAKGNGDLASELQDLFKNGHVKADVIF